MVDVRRRRPDAVATVGTARCISYNMSRVRQAVWRCVGALPDLQERLREAGRVLLKPNLLSSTRDPEAHVNTHPALVQALAEMLTAEFGCEVAIGDSCGTLSDGSTARALQVSGMERAARAAGAELYNVDAQPRHVVGFEAGEVWREIALPRNLDQFDLIVSMAKLKTHSLTFMTGAVKNVFGLVPGAAKKEAHLLAPRPEDFATLLSDLYALIRPGAAFMDGVMAMEGRGPANGSLRHLELLAASCDSVALDAFCAQVMGFEPERVPLLARCHERGLGIGRPADIVVRGEPAAAFAPGDFAHPAAYANALALRVLPRWMFRGAFDALTSRRAVIDQDACVRCGECARNCPSGAISHDDAAGRYVVDRRLCIACCCCAEVCPHDAVHIQGSWLRRALAGVTGRRRDARAGA